MRPDKKLAVTDVVNLYRDYYQGTEFDKSASKFAGLFGSPYHYERENTERGILSAKTVYSYVAQVNDKLSAPICRRNIELINKKFPSLNVAVLFLECPL